MKWLLLPLLPWLAVTGYLQLARLQSEDRFADPDGLVWGSGGGAVHWTVTASLDNERYRCRLTARAADGRILLQRDVEIDWDMGGGGLVAAAQADPDPELEIVVADRYGGGATRYFLDQGPGGVVQRPLGEAAPRLGRDLDTWFRGHVPDPYLIGLLMLGTLGWYLLLPAWFLVRRARRRRQMPG